MPASLANPYDLTSIDKRRWKDETTQGEVEREFIMLKNLKPNRKYIRKSRRQL
eukprot:SAG31_NODE_2674_length_5267_cov_13.467492_5_plen_53_part_00